MKYLKIIGVVRNPNQCHVIDQVEARMGLSAPYQGKVELVLCVTVTHLLGWGPYH
jgi:hypothetical protein